jgi:hypothetical protein
MRRLVLDGLRKRGADLLRFAEAVRRHRTLVLSARGPDIASARRKKC